MCQVFVSDKDFVAVYPMQSRRVFKDALHQFCKEIGAPVTLVVDPASENKSKDVRRFCHQVGTNLQILEEHTQWANHAELYIGLLKESVCKDLCATNCPMLLWDYCIERHAKIQMQSAKVSKRVRDANGRLIGSHDDNPMLNTSLYEVEFPDGAVKQYAANIITTENMYAQVDANGQTHTLLESIIDFEKDGHALTKDNMYISTKAGVRRVRQTTIGWKLLVRWKDGSEQWVPLKLLKESNPVDVPEFAAARDIHHEPVFCWWVPWTLKKRDRGIAAVNSRVRRATHKYGIEVPTSVTHAIRIDTKNGNTFWRDAIDKEMMNVAVAFHILDDSDNLAPGYTKSSSHLIFGDAKMNFTRKARWVKDRHLTPDPEGSTYAGVVSRESIRIALTYAALNGIDVMAADIQHAFL